MHLDVSWREGDVSQVPFGLRHVVSRMSPDSSGWFDEYSNQGETRSKLGNTTGLGNLGNSAGASLLERCGEPEQNEDPQRNEERPEEAP